MRFLIVEDEFLIARMMADALTHAGHTVAGIAGSVDKAIQYLAETECDAAIVDANLSGHCAVDIGAALRERGIPFVVTTGYSQRQLLGALSEAPFLKKPVAQIQICLHC
jgi:DNA-binding response OmpR family regulator